MPQIARSLMFSSLLITMNFAQNAFAPDLQLERAILVNSGRQWGCRTTSRELNAHSSSRNGYLNLTRGLHFKRN